MPAVFTISVPAFAEYIVRKENAVCTHNEIGLESAAFKLKEPCVCAVPQRAAIIVKIRNVGGGAVFGRLV